MTASADWWWWGIIAVFSAALLLAGEVTHRKELAGENTLASALVRYPGEEQAAVRACETQGQRLQYWSLENPRRKGATLVAQCTGVVTVRVDFKARAP